MECVRVRALACIVRWSVCASESFVVGGVRASVGVCPWSGCVCECVVLFWRCCVVGSAYFECVSCASVVCACAGGDRFALALRARAWVGASIECAGVRRTLAGVASVELCEKRGACPRPAQRAEGVARRASLARACSRPSSAARCRAWLAAGCVVCGWRRRGGEGEPLRRGRAFKRPAWRAQPSAALPGARAARAPACPLSALTPRQVNRLGLYGTTDGRLWERREPA